MFGYNCWLKNWYTRGDNVQVQWFINLFAAFSISFVSFCVRLRIFLHTQEGHFPWNSYFRKCQMCLVCKTCLSNFQKFSSKNHVKIITIRTWLYLKLTFVTNSVILRLSPIFLKYLNIQNMLNFTGQNLTSKIKISTFPPSDVSPSLATH